MATRIVEWKKPYTWWEAIEITKDKVINLRLRDENNLIIYDEWDDEIYVDLQLEDGIEPTDAFPVWITTGRVLVADDWDKTWTLISAKTTSGDNIQLLYADDWTLWIDNWTWTFKQVYLSTEIATILADYATKDYVDAHDTVISSSEPEEPYEWMLWYNTTNDKLKVYDWTAWQDIGSWWWWADIEYVTQAEYDALPSSKLTDDKHYFIYSTSGWGWWQPTSPMCWYKFDWDYTDSTSSFWDATWTATFQTLSSWTQALQTDGTNIVVLPSGITANSLTTWTIACWVKPLANGYFVWVNNLNYYYDMSMFMSTAGRCYAEWWWGSSLHSNATIDKTDASLSNDWRLFILKSDGTTVYMNINWQAFDNITPNNTEIFWGWDSFGVWGRSSNEQPCATLMSNLVISNTYWDDTTCLDMYNQTKANYWIS